MTARTARAPRPPTSALGVAVLAGCAAVIAPGEPRTVNGLTILPYETHRECARTNPGDRLEYTFEATQPVGFEIRYRDGSAVVSPIVREGTRADAGVFIAADTREYCLAWEAGGAGALIDYRVRLRPAAQR